MENQTILADYDRQFSWHNYNESQTREKTLFVNILFDLCSLIKEQEHKVGRKPAKTKDVIFSVVLQQYLNISSRRLQSDLKLFKEAEFIDSDIPFNTLLDHLDNQDLKYQLKELIEISALPLKEIELDFAIDSTGFGISRYVTYFDFKYNKDRRQRCWRKCHAVCGVKTNIITSVDITESTASDMNKFEELAKDTDRNFDIRNFCADKGYLAGKHFALIKELGGQAYIPFKSNTTGSNSSHSKYRCAFKSAYKFFKAHREEYMEKYHKRSNIESTFSMIKRRFGNNVKCKKETSQDNEILAKVLAHNICVLVQEIFLNNIDVNFDFQAKSYVARN
jgi:transposase